MENRRIFHKSKCSRRSGEPYSSTSQSALGGSERSEPPRAPPGSRGVLSEVSGLIGDDPFVSLQSCSFSAMTAQRPRRGANLRKREGAESTLICRRLRISERSEILGSSKGSEILGSSICFPILWKKGGSLLKAGKPVLGVCTTCANSRAKQGFPDYM